MSNKKNKKGEGETPPEKDKTEGTVDPTNKETSGTADGTKGSEDGVTFPPENIGSPNEVKIRNFGTFYIEVIDTTTNYLPPKAEPTSENDTEGATKVDEKGKEEAKPKKKRSNFLE